ncbi:MAG TPA: hypothetical protein DIT26_06990 [Mesotoga infera]|uniref:Uncharacterized protein n=1 Tax=Mesotoga infera TaxID=1236046 RepID=A0A3D3TMD0_9BACT|nr:hypothetical protein [Mesotoga infera]
MKIVGLLRSAHSERWLFLLYEIGVQNLVIRLFRVLLGEGVILLQRSGLFQHHGWPCSNGGLP